LLPPAHTYQHALAYLLRAGNLKVPASRYGTHTTDCAPVAYAVARIVAADKDEPLTADALEHAMGLVVNNHDDPFNVIREHGTDAERELIADLIEEVQREDWIADARRLGREAGRNVASWAADGNTSDEHRRNVLALMESGDPEGDHYLPPRPNLSGEESTPDAIYREVTGRDEVDTDEDIHLRDAFADAWEEGASDVFELECERVLRAGLADAE
jgi:hypothetical protein